MTRSLVFACAVACGLAFAGPAAAQDAAGLGDKLERVQRLLDDWQLVEAAAIAAELERTLPDVPPVQAVLGEVKFHQGDYEGARRLLRRASEGGSADPLLLQLAESTYEETAGFVSVESEHFVLRTPAGKDEILADTALWALEKAYAALTQAFDYEVPHKIPVDVLHDARGLAAVSTLTVQEIETSGTIALCKFNRLMITSPKALARGYAWLDTLSHELIHLIISEKSRNTVPIWLHEGLAKYMQSLWRGQRGLALTPASEQLLAQAVKKNELITFEQMHPSMAKLPSQEATALAFAEVFTVIEYLMSDAVTQGKKSPYAVTNTLLDTLATGKNMDRSLQASAGTNLAGLQKRWKRYLKKRPFKLKADDKPRPLRFVHNARKGNASVDEEEDEAALFETTDDKAKKFVRLGNLLRGRARLKAATVEYEKARGRLKSMSPSLNNRVAGIYLRLDDTAGAARILDETVKVYPDDPQTRVLRGRLFLAEKKYKQARGEYERALWENPFHPEVHAGLYQIADKTNDASLKKKAERNLGLLSGHAKENPTARFALAEDGEPFGTLSLSSDPWGELFIDGRPTGMITPVTDLPLRPGTYLIRVEDRVSGQVQARSITVQAGQAVRERFTLQDLDDAARQDIAAREDKAQGATLPDAGPAHP